MTILRKAEYEALSKIRLSGRVIDLGGGTQSEYRALMQGADEIVTANKDVSSSPDIVCDFEEPLPIPDASFDTALLMNVLEHVFEYRRFLAECVRILRPGGTILLTTPFLFPYHPSPGDFHRYTASALRRSLAEAGCTDIVVIPLGTGVMAARWLFLERLLPAPLRFLSVVMVPLSDISDALLAALVHALGKKYQPDDYALGFFATATKPL